MYAFFFLYGIRVVLFLFLFWFWFCREHKRVHRGCFVEGHMIIITIKPSQSSHQYHKYIIIFQHNASKTRKTRKRNIPSKYEKHSIARRNTRQTRKMIIGREISAKEATFRTNPIEDRARIKNSKENAGVTQARFGDDKHARQHRFETERKRKR